MRGGTTRGGCKGGTFKGGSVVPPMGATLGQMTGPNPRAEVGGFLGEDKEFRSESEKWTNTMSKKIICEMNELVY